MKAVKLFQQHTDLSKLKTFDPLKREQEGVLNEITAATDLVL